MKRPASKRLLLFGPLLALLISCSLVVPFEPTPTATASPTDTATPTFTPTPTATATPTNTPTPTPAPTTTPTPTLAPFGRLQHIPSGFVYLGDKRTLALGFNMSGGGAIGSLLYNGRELVDHRDFGRYIQLSLYDGSQHYKGTSKDAFGNWGWNPIQAGSKSGVGARVLEYRRSGDGIYIKANGKEWGSKNVDSDVIFETWAWARDNYFEVHVRATHTGSDLHTSTDQEFPATYFDSKLTTEFGYFGDSPFAARSVESQSLLSLPSPCHLVNPTENWVAFANESGRGLMLALPPQPFLTPRWRLCYFGSGASPVGYAVPLAVFDNPPNAVHELTFYLIPGYIKKSRAIVYDLLPHTTWMFDLNSAEGWNSASGVVAVDNGVLSTHLARGAFLTYANLQAQGAQASTVTLSAQVQAAQADLCLYFLTAADSYWGSDKSSCQPALTDGFHTYTFDLAGNPAWANGLITQLGFTTSQPSAVDIDYIYLK
jgi:hypothetical protein